MGVCSSAPLTDEEKAANERSKKLQQELSEQHQADILIHKLLLLGAGESGKSTLFKQMISIYGKGFDERARRNYSQIVKSNIISCAKTLAKQSQYWTACTTQAGMDAKQYIDDQMIEDIGDKEAQHLMALWNDPGIQQTYAKRSNYQLTDSCAYFFDSLPRIIKPDYVPSEQDVMRSRVRTTGIVENEFEISGNRFKMFDVGGQRNERKKWIHCFENVTAVLFVAAISAYDQRLYEDEATNRMEEALNLFGEICDSRWFSNTSIILFLNKKDLFIDKLKTVPLDVCFDGQTLFPAYEGPGTFVHCRDFIVDQFLARNKNDNKEIYYHVTTATDRTNTRTVFDAVKDIIIKESLRQAGLLG